MSNKPGNNNPMAFYPLFIGLGMCFGTVIGAVSGNIPMGICLGMGVGAIGAAVFIAVTVSKNKKDENNTEDK